MITSSGVCIHSDGNFLSRCYKGSVSLSECEAACTSSNSCVGYYHGNSQCYLLPSSQFFSMCQSGYTFIDRTMAETSDDLVGYSANTGQHLGYSCYARNEGKIAKVLSYYFHHNFDIILNRYIGMLKLSRFSFLKTLAN